MSFKKLLIASVLAVSSVGSFAQTVVPDAVGPSTGDLRWNGTIQASCNLASFIDGTVVANPNQTVLSSTFSGGAKAFVNARTNVGNYKLVFGTPVILNGAGADIGFTGTFDLVPAGAGTLLNGTPVGDFAATNGELVFTGAGIYQAGVDATATQPTGQAFPAGSYTIRVPVTCVAG